MREEAAMKARLRDHVVTVEDVMSDIDDAIIPRGTRGTIVEAYDRPTEGYAVDLALPDPRLVGGYRFASVILRPHQFDVVSRVAVGQGRGAS
jgi:hypothetical protein